MQTRHYLGPSTFTNVGSDCKDCHYDAKGHSDKRNHLISNKPHGEIHIAPNCPVVCVHGTRK